MLLLNFILICYIFKYIQCKSYCSNNYCKEDIFKWNLKKNKELFVGGIFPMSGGWPGGQSCLPSAIMALNEVNLNQNILSNYRLRMIWYNSECNPGKGTSNLYELLYRKGDRKNDIVMLLGPGCSDVSSSVAEAAQYWNLTVLSFGSSSPALSNRDRFKSFYRTHPSAILNNPARLAICKKYNWKKIATLQDSLEVFTSTVDNLEKEAKTASIEIKVRQTFNNDPTDAIAHLKKQDARIIVGVFYEDKARKVFCRAYREGMLFPKYVWLIIGWYSEKWYLQGDDNEVGCNKTEMEIAVFGHITTEIQALSDTHEYKKFESGYNVNDYIKNFNEFVSSDEWKQYIFKIENNKSSNLYSLYDKIENKNSEYIEKLGGHLERALAYDAVWAMAITLNKTLQKFGTFDNFSLDNYTINEFIKKSMDETNFEGISGPVWFTGDGDRITKVLIEQLQNVSGKLKYVKLGTHILGTFDCCQNITWGKSLVPPVDGIQYVKVVKRMSSEYYKLFCIISFSLILITLVFLIINIVFKNKEIIKNSVPEINSIMLVGCLISIFSVVVLGYKNENLTTKMFNFICQAKVWFLSIGFTTAYSAILTKIWYVYSLGLRYKKLKIDTIKHGKFKIYSFSLILILIDVMILIFWSLHDPLKKSIISLPNEIATIEDTEIVYKPELEICNCKNMIIWIGVLFSFKGFLIILGLFLSYETWSFKFEHINDSKFAALCIYNTAVLSTISTPIVLIIQNEQDAAFAFLASIILVCSFIPTLLIFFPKVKEIIRVKKSSKDTKANDTENKDNLKYEEQYQNLITEKNNLNDLILQKEKLLELINTRISSDNSKRNSKNLDVTPLDNTSNFPSQLCCSSYLEPSVASFKKSNKFSNEQK